MMENNYRKSIDNAAVAELTSFLSTETVPWDSISVSSKNILLNAGQCSEEHVLKCTFKACDPEQTGKVSVFRIIEYLQEMTGHSCEDWRFRSLYKRLDPEERGVAVDFSTFHSVMKDWIADCRQEGEEAADLTNSINDLQHDNKQLVVQNIKLQRTIETAEELNSRLSEEISELKGKLKGTQQALEQARVMANELEDLKVFSKSLEEENSKLQTQARLLEKEQQFLSIQVDNLQEENKKLLLEKESTKCKIKELFTQKDKMKSQLYEYENLISCKDAALNEKAKRTEELTLTLDEYRMVVQELKVEVSTLQDQLGQTCQHLDMLSRDSLQSVKACLKASAQPLCSEIEESQNQGFSEEADLPSPLCGVLPTLKTNPVTARDTKTLTEELVLDISGTEDIKALLQRAHSLSYLDFVTDVPIMKNQEYNQPLHFPSEKVVRMVETKKDSQAGEQISNNKMIGVTPNKKMCTCSSNMDTQGVCSTCQEIPTFSSAKLSSEGVFRQQALAPVFSELIPAIGKKQHDNLFEILFHRFFGVSLGCLLIQVLQQLLISGLLLACVTLLAMFCFILPYSQHPVWTELKGNTWPSLQLQYLQPPPV